MLGGQSLTQENSTYDVMKIEDHMESEGECTAGDMECTQHGREQQGFV